MHMPTQPTHIPPNPKLVHMPTNPMHDFMQMPSYSVHFFMQMSSNTVHNFIQIPWNTMHFFVQILQYYMHFIQMPPNTMRHFRNMPPTYYNRTEYGTTRQNEQINQCYNIKKNLMAHNSIKICLHILLRTDNCTWHTKLNQWVADLQLNISHL